MGRLLERAQPVREAYRKHDLATHAAAIAFRVLVALVPLVMLGLALLGAFGLQDVWADEIAPALEERLQLQVFAGIDYIVNSILDAPTLGLIAFASALLLWEFTRAVRATTRALNTIHGCEDERSFLRIALVTVGLAIAVGALLLTAVLVTIVGGRMGWAAAALRWPLAAVLLGAGVALLLRYAPAEQPHPKWASIGSGAIVAGWIVLSAGFGIWVREIASYDSATGSLLAFLILTTYVLGLSVVFLVGVEIDEALRQDDGRSGRATSSAARRRRPRSSSRRES